MIEFNWAWFEESHHNNNNEKFKVGQMVKYIGRNYKLNPELAELEGNIYEVRAVNKCDESSVEYLLAGFPCLVWEEELESVEEKNV